MSATPSTTPASEPPTQSALRVLADDLVRSLFSLLFPTSCLICRAELIEPAWTGTCRVCWNDIQPWTGPACSGCGLPIEPAAAAWGGAEVRCSRCRDREYNFDLARSYGLYYGRLRGAILAMKFHRRDRLASRLGAMLASAADLAVTRLQSAQSPEPAERAKPFDMADPAAPPEAAAEPLLIVPVPLHPSRHRERGFNQAELLARALARSWRVKPEDGPAARLKVAAGCLIRHRRTGSQAGLSLEGRRENVHEAFTIRRPERVGGRRVILVDDVMTTGATASACAAALKDAGAAQVMVLTLARATVDSP